MTRLGRAGVFSSGVLIVAGAAACSGILGIQDRSLDPQTQDAAAGDSGGSPDATGAETSTDAPTSETSTTDSGAPVDSGSVVDSSCPDPCPVITGLNLPESITADGTNIYWTEAGDNFSAINGTVKGCPLAGCGNGPKVYATAQANPGVIVSDGQKIYWSNYDGSSSTGGGIYWCPVSGCTGSPTLLVSASEPWGIAIDSTYLYWVSQADESLHRVLLSGGTDEPLWDGGDILALGSIYNAQYVTVDDAGIYVIDDWSDLFKIPLGGGNALPLYSGGASASSGDWHFLLDPGGILFGDGTKQQILRASTTTPDANAPLVTGLPAPSGIARDPATGDIYWADNGTGTASDGQIGRIAADGGGKTVLVASLHAPVTLTVAGNTVYYVDRGQLDNMGYFIPSTGAIYRTPK